MKEYVLGVEALGRPESFDPRVDPIARVEASRLRNRLELSYANGDAVFDIRIMLPRGTYVPQIETVSPAPAASKQDLGKYAIAWESASVIGGFLIGAIAATFWSGRNVPTQTLRTSVMPPRDVLMQAVALSPDGARLVIAASKHGLPHLYLRSLAYSFEARLVPGTEGASYPFWSPNGSSILGEHPKAAIRGHLKTGQ